MTGVRVRVCLETEDYEPERFRGSRVHVGKGTLAPNWHGPREALIVPGLPDLLRTIADQLESAMTTGPDPTAWLEGDPE